MPRGTHLDINPEFSEALSAQGLHSFDDFMRVQSDDYAARSRTNSCVRLTLRVKDAGRVAYLKRDWYVSPVWKAVLRASRACIEHRNLLWLRAHGLPAPEWIAWGEERRGFRLKRCFIMTAGVGGTQDLEQFLLGHSDRRLDKEALLHKRGAIRTLADHVREMHGNAYVDNDLHFRNILIGRKANGEYRFAFVDSPKGRIARGLWLERGIRYDLACLNKRARWYLSRTDCLRFYLRYLRKSDLDRQDRLEMARIEALSARMHRKAQRKRLQRGWQLPTKPFPWD